MATSYRTRLGPFQESYDQVYDAIQEEFKNVGFGVLTNVDVKAVFESKLNKTNEPRRHIMGICNPVLAYELMSIEESALVHMPCRVALHDKDEKHAGVRIDLLNGWVAIGQLLETEEGKNFIKEKVEPKLAAVREALLARLTPVAA